MRKLYPAQFKELFSNDNYDGIEFSNGFFVSFRDVPEALTQGSDFAEALDMAEDALKTAMEFYSEDGKPYPVPSEPQHGDVMIELK